MYGKCKWLKFVRQRLMGMIVLMNIGYLIADTIIRVVDRVPTPQITIKLQQDHNLISVPQHFKPVIITKPRFLAGLCF